MLFFCRANMEVASMVSADDGLTWSAPAYFLDGRSTAFRALLSVPQGKNVSHVATGPPTSIQLASGRIVVPTAFCYNGGFSRCASNAPGDWFAATLYSDDLAALVATGGTAHDGAVWRVSTKSEGGNECQASPTQNGSLLLNQRTNLGHRQQSWSHDGGATWDTPAPVAVGGKAAASCCCSTVFVASSSSSSSSSLATGTRSSAANSGTLVFSGPDSTGRSNMTVYTSKDSGATWQWLMAAEADSTARGAYSSLVAINSTHFGLAFEGSKRGQPTAGLQYFAAALPHDPAQ